jgi:hypothetical protein
MGLKLANNASTVLAGAIDNAVTQISVSVGAGAKFPTLAAGDWFPLTIVDGSGNYEIVKCTARAGDVFTIVRAQEGTAAAPFASGSRVDLRVTAACFAGLMQEANNLADVASVAAAQANLGIEFATAAQIIADSANGSIITTDKAWAAAGWTNLGNVTGSITLDANAGTKFYGTLTGNVTVNAENLKSGQQIDFEFRQDATGGRTISWNAAFGLPNNTAPTVQTAASQVALIGSIFQMADFALVTGLHI